MSYLPDEPLQVHGGCLCRAVRYTINVPAKSQRPLAPGALPTPISDHYGHMQEVETRFPLISIDHCDSCRLASGSLFQSWFITQHDWVQFHLQQRQTADSGTYAYQFNEGLLQNYDCAEAALPTSNLMKETYMGAFRSSEHVIRTFCARCGTSISYCYDGDRGTKWTLGPLVDIALGTLDKDDLQRVKVERQLWFNHGVDWVKRLIGVNSQDQLICHPDGRPSEKV